MKPSRSKSVLNIFALLALLLGTVGIMPAHAAGILYAAPAASGTGDCSSWTNACTLQTALTDSTAGDEIWVAAGLHKPTTVTTDRTATFQLKSGVAVYGGFDGTETARNERDFDANVTILSGDIDNNDTNTDGNFIAETTLDIKGSNSYHVVAGSGTDNNTILDGFVLSAGQANGPDLDNQGGGMVNTTGALKLANLTFSGNHAYHGGGMYSSDANPTLTSVTFNGNNADGGGGGIYNRNGNPTLTFVTFSENTANGGGGMANVNGSSPLLTNVTFNQNIAENSGGGMYNHNSSPNLSKVMFDDNAASGYGGGMHNLSDSNPSLTDVAFTGNQAGGWGGGMANASSAPKLENVTFDGNSAGYYQGIYPFATGGGIYNYLSSPELTNVTFSNNNATESGGGMYGGNSIILNSTFNSNGAANGGGLFTTEEPTLINTLIANSTSGGDCAGISNPSIASSNNLIKDSANACMLTNGTNGNIIGLDPGVDPLANNGGFTQTHALQNTSPAIDAGSNTSCPDTDQRGVLRPWDGDASGNATCDIGAYEVPSPSPVFADVPVGYWAISHIESLYANGITGGCTASPLNYCPNSTVTRAQMAVFLLIAEHGTGYTPPPASGLFNDVPANNGFAPWIEQLYNEGITGGCGNGNYCPNAPVTRAQMAVFLLVAEHGTGYTPPPASGVFTDVPVSSGFAPWIEQLANEGITGGCGDGNFCPNNPVNRGQMAVFLVTAFNLP